MGVIKVIGGGLAGCEAAYTLAQRGIQVRLYEMKPKKYTPAHHFEGLCELVCSNSLKAMRVESAAGLLKEEMRMLGSITMEAAQHCQVAAGGALAVDREGFSLYVTEKIRNHPNIEVVSQEVTDLEEDAITVIATGPLTSDSLAERLLALCGQEQLSFYDAAAPIITYESIDQSRVFSASRYGRGDADYINCPFEREEYDAFYDALITAESAPLKSFEAEGIKVFEGCMPVEVMAKRGRDTLRFGPLKPVGLTNPATGRRPWAVVQLRKENTQGSLYNLVGFQTNLKFGEQKRVFSMIPGLENAEFMRFGVMHRNTFLNSPKLLLPNLAARWNQRLFFAGQLTGVEGYVESAASGILAGINAAALIIGKQPLILPKDTMLGALIAYISDPEVDDFQPMSSNMGILPPLATRIRNKNERYAAVAQRALSSMREALEQYYNKVVDN